MTNLDELVQISVCLIDPLDVLGKLVVPLWSGPVLQHSRVVDRDDRLKDSVVLKRGIIHLIRDSSLF